MPAELDSPRERVIDKSRRVVRAYAAGRDDWNPASSLSALLRQMQREYEGRFVYELIQNAYDAHPPSGQGDIAVVLDVDEGDFGVLYVANRGLPFTEDNFAAICELAQSDKTPDESIGNKGVGFKSVLQVCDWPEIYSAANLGEERFGGFCFTFARLDQYDDLAAGDEHLAARMREDIAPYFLPVPLEAQPPRVLRYSSDGFASVIRLPIKSTPALEIAKERVANLLDEEVPVHLFLERLQSLEITLVESASEPVTRRLLRESVPVDDRVEDPDQRYEYVNLGEQGPWFIASRRMPAAAMREAIAESIADGEIEESWASWSHDSWVSVAVRTDGQEIRPRLYTFLPMEQGATAPLHGHIHAPFSTKLARTSVNELVPLNSRLLDCAARSSTAAVLAYREAPRLLPDTALVDLLAWQGHHHDRVTKSFVDAGVDMQVLEVVPVEPLPGGRTRAAFASTYAWAYPNLALIDRQRLSRQAGAELVSGTIAGPRFERLEAYCKSFFDVGFNPEAALRAEWIEAVAADLHARKSRPRIWDRFYADLAQLFERDADVLRGRSILLGDDQKLHRSPTEDEGKGQPFVFFPPARERTDEDDEVEGDVDLKPPATLRRALVLMNEELGWTRRDGGTRRRTPARRFLEENKLVRRFKTVDLLEHVGRAVARSRRTDLARDALRFVFRLSIATRSLRQRDLRALGLRVPTRDGWRPATDAIFSPGWGTPLAQPMSDLIERASPVCPELATVGGALLSDPTDWPFSIDDREAWLTFLGQIGVRDGLWPIPVPHGMEGHPGSAVEPIRLGRRFDLTSDDAARWVGAVKTDSRWLPYHPQTPYRPREVVSVIPGQRDYEEFDHRTRILFADLVVAGLEMWPDSALEIVWHRFHHPQHPDERRWPSPIAAFLSLTPWLPVSDPGQRQDESFVAPHDAWYFGDSRGEEPPNFSPLVIGRIRRKVSAGERVLGRLATLGLGDWTAVRDSIRLLRHLAGLVENYDLPETGLHPFRRAYEDAWSRAGELETSAFLEQAGDLPVVVSRGGDLSVLRASDAVDAPLFLVGEGGSLAARILESSDLPVLAVASGDEARIRPLLESLLHDRLVAADAAELDVATDTGSVRPDGSGELLVAGNWRWLGTLVALILETKRSRFAPLGPRRRREIGEQLLRIRIVKTFALELRIAGVRVDPPERHRRVVPLADEVYPTLIVVSRAAPPTGLEDLIAIARPMCELLGMTQHEDPLLLALERLHTQGCSAPGDDDFARVLEIDAARVAEVRRHLGSSVDRMLRLLVPLLAYHENAEVALSLLDLGAAIATEDELRAAVRERAPGIADLDAAIVASREQPSPSGFRDALGLDYSRFNGALASLAPEYEPIHNRDGHSQAMTYFVQRNRARLIDELRLRHLAAFRSGASLEAYVAARSLSILPDPAWLDAYDVPPDVILDAHAQAWLRSDQSRDSEARLPDVDRARSENSAVLSRVAEVASRVIPAWARKRKAPMPEIWTQAAPAHRLAVLASERGVLDFELLDEDDVLAWLEAGAWWPGTMPLTLDRTQLGLSESEVADAAELQGQERQERLRRRRVLRLDQTEFSAESDSYREIFAYVSGTIRDELLATSTRAVKLRELPEGRVARSSGRSTGSRSPQSETMSDVQKSAVGLVGETIAYRWLQRHYPDACSPGAWVSSYCETIGEPPGNDSLGYDFQIALSTRTLYFEVKATSGTDTRFELGESEVRKAAECARRRDDYRIIFISSALDSHACRLDPLPNPMDAANQSVYGFPGAGLVCTFNFA